MPDSMIWKLYVARQSLICNACVACSECVLIDISPMANEPSTLEAPIQNQAQIVEE